MAERRAIEGRLQRRRGASPERREALRAFNAEQTYHGRCRVCGSTWSGALSEVPRACPNCGLEEPGP